MKYDFAISYEIINREYECIVLLKKELERRGYSVLLFQATALSKRMNAEVVVMHSFYNNRNFAMIYYLFGKKQKIFNLHWEEIYHRSIEPKIDDRLMPKQYARKVSHLAWGKIEKEDLLRAGVSDEKIALVGALHLDLISKDIFYKKNEIAKKYSLDPNKKWILFYGTRIK